MTSAPDTSGPDLPDLDAYSRRIAEEIRSIMARKNVTQTAIAEDVFDKYPQWVQARVKGYVPMTFAEALAIADYLDTNITELAWAAKGGRPTPGDGQPTVALIAPNLTLITGEADTSPPSGRLQLAL